MGGAESADGAWPAGVAGVQVSKPVCLITELLPHPGPSEPRLPLPCSVFSSITVTPGKRSGGSRTDDFPV